MAEKRLKAQGKEVGWFELYIDLKSEMQQRLFSLEERIKALEAEAAAQAVLAASAKWPKYDRLREVICPSCGGLGRVDNAAK